MLIEVKVPQLSESVAEATLVSWHKKAGQAIKADENLVDIETDKVVLETPATQRGKVNATAASDRMAIQSNNVDVDDRGYIYIVDRANTGMHILELTGPARSIANWAAAVK